ncbi:MAG: hypothetical protein JW745_03895 [Sedimentisphaerales bacterium]|nr:hypothetical protein [Sedimentisphaerales bacterium]MBN2841716.1 hypothetical protein [Sedimentisphaerales bacterium]
MTVVKARDLQKDQKGVVFNFRDIAAEGQAMLDAARAESKRIIEQAKIQTTKNQEKIYKEAYEKGLELGRQKGYEDAFAPAEKKGYDQGYATALAEVKNKFEDHIAEPLADLKRIIEYFETNKKQLIWQAEQSFVVLAVKLAEKVIRREIEVNPELICQSVRAALEVVAHTTNVVVKVSPCDVAIIEDLKGSLGDVLGRFENVSIKPDEAVEKGGCIVQTERGRVDARIETQLARIARDILEPGAVLDIEQQQDTQEIDKLIRETSANSNAEVVADELEQAEPSAQIQQAQEPEQDLSQMADEQTQQQIDQATRLREQVKDSQVDPATDQDEQL